MTRECTHFAHSIIILFLQDVRVFNSDFEKSVLGMEHHLRHFPKNHSLFIPEVLVELEKKQDTKHPGVEGMTLTRIAKDHNATLPEQEELLKLAEKAKKVKHSNSNLDKESIETMQVVKESISNIDRQKEEYERLQAKAKEGEIFGSTSRDLNHTYEDIQNLQCHDMGENLHSSNSTTGKQPNSHGKLGDPQWQYSEHHLTDQGQNANQHYSTAREHRGLEQNQPHGANLRQQQGANQWQPHGTNQWQQQGANRWQKDTDTAAPYRGNPADTAYSASAEQYDQRINTGGMGISQSPLDSPGRHHRNTPGYQDDASRQKNEDLHQHSSSRNEQQLSRCEIKASHNDPRSKQSQNLPIHDRDEGDVQRELGERQNVKAATGDVDPASMNLGVGSLIQIPSSDQEILRYGTIKWIGLLPNVQGKIAGIELVNQ